jgi:hypothetical protein
MDDHSFVLCLDRNSTVDSRIDDYFLPGDGTETLF